MTKAENVNAGFREHHFRELWCVKQPLRPPPADGGSSRSPEGSTDEREELRQDARDRKYRAQAAAPGGEVPRPKPAQHSEARLALLLLHLGPREEDIID